MTPQVLSIKQEATGCGVRFTVRLLPDNPPVIEDGQMVLEEGMAIVFEVKAVRDVIDAYVPPAVPEEANVQSTPEEAQDPQVA